MARSKSGHQTGRLFRSTSGQDQLFEKSYEEELEARRGQLVECLGMTFENDGARRAHFLGKLKEGIEKLHASLGGVPFTTVDDSVIRMMAIERWPMGGEARLRDLAERMRHADSSKDLLQRWNDEVGFPHGEIEDILKLSDPPYYTACPNPFVELFALDSGRPYDPESTYNRQPLSTDVSEGKYDPFYKYHPYHTKVPHKAVMRYILHYTNPGDLIFDGFCGSGMTGVAAQLCGNRSEVESLGYRVDENDSVFRQFTNQDGQQDWVQFSNLGLRRTILIDLCPAATFIAYHCNTPVDERAFKRDAEQLLHRLEEECGWMFQTLHTDGKTYGKINYVAWSDAFRCPECADEIVFWEAAVNKPAGKVHDEFPCPCCGATLSKRKMDRVWETSFDKYLQVPIKQAKQVPIFINYSVGSKRHKKELDENDLYLLDRIKNTANDYDVPTIKLPSGFNTRQPIASHGFTHVHHFYTERNLLVLAAASSFAENSSLFSLISTVAFRITKRYGLTYQSGVWGAGGGPTTGTLYIPSLGKELNMMNMLRSAVKKIEARSIISERTSIISTASSTSVGIDDNAIDYIFLDPPFGANIMYSEMNFIWESWLRILTNNKTEAIESKHQGKSLYEYHELMRRCFTEAYRILKPGRWMTVEFSNTKASVWNTIQGALQESGFVVANVAALDKKKGSFKAITTPTAVKQDLIISAYKPNGGLESRFKLEAGTKEGAWDFVRNHLKQLPVFVEKDGQNEVLSDRQNYLLFDRMVAFHVQRGVMVPLSAAEFYMELAQRFPERDSMYFLPDQVAEYDKKRMSLKEVLQLEIFVIDESSAIQWLRQQLSRKPQTFQDINPQFLKEIGGWQKHERTLELSELLEQNFLRYIGMSEVPTQIHSYLSANFKELRNLPKDHPGLRAKAKDRWYVPDPNQAAQREQLRERALLREFEEYRESTQRRLKVFRLEAVRAGFKKAWQDRNYQIIIAVARKIPENVLQEDPKLLMWYDQALTRKGESA